MAQIDQAHIYDWLYSNFGNAFNTVFAPQLEKNNPFSRWLSDQQGRYENLYGGQVANQPAGFNAMNFLSGLTNQYDVLGNQLSQTKNWAGVDPMKEWMNFAPSQRGETPSKFAGPVSWKSLFGSR